MFTARVPMKLRAASVVEMGRASSMEGRMASTISLSPMLYTTCDSTCRSFWKPSARKKITRGTSCCT